MPAVNQDAINSDLGSNLKVVHGIAHHQRAADGRRHFSKQGCSLFRLPVCIVIISSDDPVEIPANLFVMQKLHESVVAVGG